MTLKSSIVNTKPREKSGSTSGSRFDYQRDWSLCKLLESHQILGDYVAIFDWHDDLVIMDSELSPASVQFYQIKGKKSKTWSVTDLLHSKKDSVGNFLLSILGKLYDCKSKYPTETTSLNFISNAGFQVDLEDKTSSIGKNDICLIELDSKSRKRIMQKVKDEHKLSTDPVFDNLTFLRVADLSLEDSGVHTQGKISNFLNGRFPDGKFNIPSVYRMLFDEVKRRASYTKDVLTYEDLIENKSICKRQFEDIIKATGISKDYTALWDRIDAELQRDGLSFQERKSLKQTWKKLEVEKMEPNNSYLLAMTKSIQSIINSEESINGFNGLNLHNAVQKIKGILTGKQSIKGYDDVFITALILFEYYE